MDDEYDPDHDNGATKNGANGEKIQTGNYEASNASFGFASQFTKGLSKFTGSVPGLSAFATTG